MTMRFARHRAVVVVSRATMGAARCRGAVMGWGGARAVSRGVARGNFWGDALRARPRVRRGRGDGGGRGSARGVNARRVGGGRYLATEADWGGDRASRGGCAGCDCA